MHTFCPECGPGVNVDNDGCCVHCGATATGKAVDCLYVRYRIIWQPEPPNPPLDLTPDKSSVESE